MQFEGKELVVWTVAKGWNPRIGNTGVINTIEEGLTASVDWFSCTFHTIHAYTDVCGILGLDISNFTLMENGLNGYRRTAVYGNISILFDPPENTVNMGCHVNLTGEGCREFEKNFNEHFNWSTFISICLNFDVKFTRIDIAIDDYVGYFTLQQVMSKVKKGHLTSRFSKARNFEEHLLSDGSTSGQTIYFGKGEVMFRFYDKYQERINKGYSLDKDLKLWNRYEIQLRGKRATEACKVLAYEAYDTGELAKGLFANYLTFRVPSKTDTNKARWEVCDWWRIFLGDCAKISLSQVPPTLSVQRTKNWLDFQVVSSLAMVYEALDQDPMVLRYFLALGKDKMDDKKLELINRFNDSAFNKNNLKKEMAEYLMNTREAR